MSCTNYTPQRWINSTCSENFMKACHQKKWLLNWIDIYGKTMHWWGWNSHQISASDFFSSLKANYFRVSLVHFFRYFNLKNVPQRAFPLQWILRQNSVINVLRLSPQQTFMVAGAPTSGTLSSVASNFQGSPLLHNFGSVQSACLKIYQLLSRLPSNLVKYLIRRSNLRLGVKRASQQIAH